MPGQGYATIGRWQLLAVAACVLLALPIYYLYNPLQATFFPPCPSRLLLHLYCPGCGSQRALHAMLHGNVAGAWGYNPAFMVAAPLLIADRLLAWAPKTAGLQQRLAATAWIQKAIAACVLCYFVLRNVPLQQLDWLRPHP